MDFFVVAQMSVDLVGFVKLVGVRCGRDELEDMEVLITAKCLLPLALVIPFEITLLMSFK